MSSTRELPRRLQADRALPSFEPCLPRSANEPPAGPGWIHEIKHDGFRILAHRRGRSIRLVTRNGHDLADRFPLAAEAIEVLPICSRIIDGEAIVCDDSGLAVFDLMRGHGTSARAILLCVRPAPDGRLSIEGGLLTVVIIVHLLRFCGVSARGLAIKDRCAGQRRRGWKFK